MKTLLLLGLILICTYNMIYSQILDTQKVKIKDHTYKVMTTGIDKGKHNIWIERATDSLRYTDLGYEWSERMEIRYDWASMEPLVKEYIAPVIKQSGLSFDKETLFISMVFDLNGNMKELAIQFPEKLKIPMTVVDDFFNAVLSSGIKCSYKKDCPGLKRARFIGVNDVVKLKELQE